MHAACAVEGGVVGTMTAGSCLFECDGASDVSDLYCFGCYSRCWGSNG
jgi:hypothetical protein